MATAFEAGLRAMHGAVYLNPDVTILQILNVCTQMLEDRGLTITHRVTGAAEVYRCVEQQAPVVTGVHPTSGSCTCVIFHGEERVPIRVVRTLVAQSAHDYVVILSFLGATSFTRRETQASNRRIQFLRYDEMIHNITHHACVPAHSRYDGPREFSDDDYPKLLQSDPVAQYYDFQPGDLVRIRRRFETHDHADYLRIVVA